MKLKIITDSSCDLTANEAKELNVTVIPLSINIDGKEYKDGVDINKEKFYELLINGKGMPKTSQPPLGEFVQAFTEAKKNNEVVLTILIAKSLSGTINSAYLAKEMVDYDQIYIIDSCTTIAGIQILINEATKLNKQGKTIQEIIDTLNDLKSRIVVLACMNTLEYLYRGGRLSRVTAFVGNLINIKPLIMFKEDGSVSVISRQLGMTRANKAMISVMDKRPIDPKYGIYYYYSHNLENLEHFIAALKKFGKYLAGKIINLSPAVGCHIGDNAYGLVYVCAK